MYSEREPVAKLEDGSLADMCFITLSISNSGGQWMAPCLMCLTFDQDVFDALWRGKKRERHLTSPPPRSAQPVVTFEESDQ